MEFLEKDLEDIIYNAPQSGLLGRGLCCISYNKMLRQVDLRDYGRADLITYKINTNIFCDKRTKRRVIEVTVYELKQNRVDAQALMQAARYVKACRLFVDQLRQTHEMSNTEVTYNIVLIGKQVETKGDFTHLSDFINNVSVYTYDISWDGIYFTKQDGYVITDGAVGGSDWDKSEFLSHYRGAAEASKIEFPF